jgi:hypothetical protein
VEDGGDLPAEHGRPVGSAEGRGGGGGATAGGMGEDNGWRMRENSRRGEKPTGTPDTWQYNRLDLMARILLCRDSSKTI